ncbi:MAG: hypothetical protein AB7L76_05090 [Burkholderiaceae bacterium]
MSTTRYASAMLLAITLTAGLTACGGGDGGSGPAEPPPTTTSVPVTVLAGAVDKAGVCLDSNANNACDAAEPSGSTDASGRTTLTVPNGDVGKWPVIAILPAPAAGGAAAVPLVLKAPADRTALVTPLTTLVQAQVEATGAGTDAAAEHVRERTGLAVSPLADYRGGGSAGAGYAALLAQTVEAVARQQTAVLAPSLGRPDVSGTNISAGDIAHAVQTAVLSAAQAIAANAAAAAAQPEAEREAAIAAGAEQVVAQSGLDADTAAGQIGSSRLADEQPAAVPTGAGGTLRAFTYDGPDNWFYRAILVAAADAVPDAAGYTRYYDERASNSGGTVTTWGYGGTPARGGDLHWNGSAWVDCPIGFRSKQRTIGDGLVEYDYCDGVERGTTRIGAVDVAGRTMSSVIDDVRALPGSDSGLPLASFGPSDLSLLGTAAMPAGAQLSYRVTTPIHNAQAYDPRPGSIARAFHADVAEGGDARTDATVPCRVKTTGAPLDNYSDPAVTLEQMIAGARGKPCIYPQAAGPGGSMSLPMNEGWGTSTVSLGSVPDAATRPAGTGSFYSTTLGLRAAFTGPGNEVTYYGCLLRASDGVTRNCTPIGSGSYDIETLGDARVLSFRQSPTLTMPTTSHTIYVERGGNVYVGFVLKSPAATSVRLNLVAANALFAQLGMPALAPR